MIVSMCLFDTFIAFYLFVGTLTSIFQVFLGLQAGMIMQAHTSHKARLVRWLVWGVLLGAVGAGLCGASMNDGVIPVNKNLW